MLRTFASLVPTVSRLAGARSIASTASLRRPSEDREFEPQDPERLIEDPDDERPAPRTRTGRGPPSFNRMEILGGVAAAPVMRVAKSGIEFATFDVITNTYHRRASGEWGTNKEIHRVTIFGGQAQRCMRLLRRGSRVYVAGEMQYLSEGGPRQPRIASIKATTVEPIAKNRRDEDEERMAENA